MSKILVIVDMQNDFIDGPLGTPEAQAIVPNVIEKINNTEEETLILFTKDTHERNYLETQEGRYLPVEHCMNQTGGWCINKAVRSAWLSKTGTIVMEDWYGYDVLNNAICKNQFGSLDLANLLRTFLDSNPYYDEIEIVGLCTDICVVSNALIIKAMIPEIPVSVDSSCCAGTTPENHQKALDVMHSCQIEIR